MPAATAMKQPEFAVVPDEDRPQLTNRTWEPSPISLALEAGKTIRVEGRYDASALRSRRGYLARRGFRIHVRLIHTPKGPVTYLWADQS